MSPTRKKHRFITSESCISVDALNARSACTSAADAPLTLATGDADGDELRPLEGGVPPELPSCSASAVCAHANEPRQHEPRVCLLRGDGIGNGRGMGCCGERTDFARNLRCFAPASTSAAAEARQ
jgi:hypothetical protein